jgi:hypothetical protein
MIRLKELLTQIAEKRMAEAMRRQAASPEMEKLAKTQGLELPGASVPSDIGADKRSGMQDKPTDEPPSPQPKPAVSTNPDIVAAKERKAKRDAEIMAAAKAEFDDVMADKNDANVSPTTGKETGTALPQVDELKDTTVKSYLKKAKKSAESELRKHDEREDKAMSTDGEKHPERQQKHLEKAKEHFKKYLKRQKGISTASKKMGDK